jgi:hypothetical protein
MAISAAMRTSAGRRPAALALAAVLALAPLGLAVDVVHAAFSAHRFGDFGIFYDAARAVVHGHSPYPAATVHALRHQNRYVYPPFAALVLAPLTVLPLSVAGGAMLALSAVSIVAALRVAGVRDWRCAALALLSIAIAQGLVLGTITPVLTLALAVAWRLRDRPLGVAVALACAIAAKLFLAPVVLWLVLTRRFRAAALTAALSAGLTLGSWAAIGFRGLSGYPHLLALLSQVEETHGYSIVALGLHLGGSASAARIAAGAAAAALACLAVAVRGRGEGDAGVFGLSILLCLALSPVVWLNYLTLVLPALAAVRPRLSPLWLCLLAVWLFAGGNDVIDTWRVVLWQVDAAVLAAAFAGVRLPAARRAAPAAA